MEGIFDSLKDTALIHQSGGGTGFAFSRLRPAGDIVASTGGVASGPVSFMRVYDAATESIKQGGTRRGANMAILSVDHPDIEAFINVKSDMTTLQNFNISVAVTERFMQAVEARRGVRPRQSAHATRSRARGARATIFQPDHRERLAQRRPGPRVPRPHQPRQPDAAASAGSRRRIRAASSRCLPYESCNLGSLNLVAVREARRASAGANGRGRRNGKHNGGVAARSIGTRSAKPIPLACASSTT